MLNVTYIGYVTASLTPSQSEYLHLGSTSVNATASPNSNESSSPTAVYPTMISGPMESAYLPADIAKTATDPTTTPVAIFVADSNDFMPVAAVTMTMVLSTSTPSQTNSLPSNTGDTSSELISALSTTSVSLLPSQIQYLDLGMSLWESHR